MRGAQQLWRMNFISGVNYPMTQTTGKIKDVLPVSNPKDETIAFYSNRNGNWDIWSVGAAGASEPMPLTHWVSNEMYPIWSPDGRHLAFRTDKNGNADIWIMDSDGGNPRVFISHPAEEVWSAWSPNSKWFYFVSNRSGAFNIWIKSVNKGETQQVTTFQDFAFGLSETALFTKFAVSSTKLVVPLETRKGEIYILENVDSR